MSTENRKLVNKVTKTISEFCLYPSGFTLRDEDFNISFSASGSIRIAFNPTPSERLGQRLLNCVTVSDLPRRMERTCREFAAAK
jgi:hypothetical protein